MPVIPSVYLSGGRAVRLLPSGPGGERRVEPLKETPAELARRLGVVGEVAVIDLDAAERPGCEDNRAAVLEMLREAPCRVGGGLRSSDDALYWLDRGVTKVLLGTAAEPDVLAELPASRVVVALDVTGDEGDVLVEGRRRQAGARAAARMARLAPLADEFLVTLADHQGTLRGVPEDDPAIAAVAAAARALGGAGKTVAVSGGVASAADVARLDALGLRCQVGTALHAGALELGDAVTALARSDRPDGLYATVVVDELGVALGLVYSDDASVREAVRRMRGIYHSRRRGLWEKGLTSGAVQELVRVDLDCDRDAIRFVVRQLGAGFCHLERRTCWAGDAGLGHLFRTLESRRDAPVAGSYTNRLLTDERLLAAKLTEEAQELIEARTPDEVAGEAADVIYFAAVMCARAGVPLSAVENMLDRRSRRVRRRKGDAKAHVLAQMAAAEAARAGEAAPPQE